MDYTTYVPELLVALSVIELHNEGWVSLATIGARRILQLRQPLSLLDISALVTITINLAVVVIPALLGCSLLDRIPAVALAPLAPEEV
jgi:hypothetical protein